MGPGTVLILAGLLLNAASSNVATPHPPTPTHPHLRPRGEPTKCSGTGLQAFVGVANASNVAGGAFSAELAGSNNAACNTSSAVGAGTGNIAGGLWSFVGAGQNVYTAQQDAFAGAGDGNGADGEWSFVGSGYYNDASGEGSFVGAGGTIYAQTPPLNTAFGNVASGDDSFIGAGDLNRVSGAGSFIGAGGTVFAGAGGSTAGNQILRHRFVHRRGRQ
jgi:hypothetical protein